jgi:PKD repeat protein
MHLHKNPVFSDRAASETIGAVMLISVVVMAVAIIGVALTSQGTPEKIPALDAVISNYGNQIQIFHNGGDTLQYNEIEILVDGNPQTDTFKKDGAAWTTWSPGDSLVASASSPPEIVRIIYKGSSGSSAILTTADFSPFGMSNFGPISTSTLNAAFSRSPSSGAPPLVVRFTDLSTGSPGGWNWAFGDGDTSNVQNPTHVFGSSGTYTVSLTVTNATGSTSSVTHPITVSTNPPIPSGISPAQGSQGSSVPISVFGTGFVSGATIKLKRSGSTDITVSSVAFVSSTKLTGMVSIPAGAAVGSWDVVVTNPDSQIGTITNGFAVTTTSGPVVSSLTPDNSLPSTLVAVTVAGSNFNTGATLMLKRAGYPDIVAPSAVVVSSNMVTGNFNLATAPYGSWDVVVTNTDGQSGTLTNGFKVNIPVPAITSISPPNGPTGGSTPVTITGTDLIGATGVTFGGIAATGVTVISGTSITATTPGHAAGTVDVVVFTPNGTATGIGAFTYGETPAFGNIAPPIGPTFGGTVVTITGTNLAGTTAVTFGGAPATGVTVVSATQLTATTPFHAAGIVTVVVTTPNGTATGTGAYTYTSTAAPTFTSIAPASGPIAGSTTVIITGTNFVAGGLLGVKIDGVPATGVVRNSITQITAVTPAGTVGAKDVVITNNDGQTATKRGAYTYLATPTFTGISPAAGPLTAGTPVTITGTNLIGTTSVTFGTTAATAVTVISATQLTATAPVKTTAGVVNVVITTPGGIATGTNAYTYTAAPTFTSITPAYGRTLGGTTVIIAGNYFVNGATAVTFDGIAASAFTVNSATQITATTPADTGTATVAVTTPGGVATRTYTFADPSISGVLSRITGTRGSTYTLITIPGSNPSFIPSPYPTVTFTQGSNTMTGTVTACTATQVTFSLTIPAGQATGSYDVRVTNTDGGSATRTAAFTVT